jgi:hypothetical protein
VAQTTVLIGVPHEIACPLGGSAGISQGKSAINVKNRVISGEKEAKIELKMQKKAGFV